jgi:flagellum-specific ATP synthase
VIEQTSPGVDERLLGRVVDGLGRPLDGRPPVTSSSQSEQRIEINPLTRKLISEPLETGVRAVDSLLTIGRGQRVGIFAGSGVGKSVLLGMLAGRVAADVVVVGLIGERGREVREFCDDILGPKGLQRSVVVAAPADAAPLARLRGAFYATRVAQYFRDTGRHTVLILDSLSRFGMAQREIALSTGEPPATKGYPPSVFAKIPELVEMAGNSSNEQGSLTAFYTVLLEGDDTNDPVADTARAILDGHIFLSRDLSEMGHYPAIDVERSISRAMPRVANAQHLARAGSFKQMWSKLSRSQDLVSMGAYAQGSDPILDRALAKRDAINTFLRQGMTESTPFSETVERLAQFA